MINLVFKRTCERDSQVKGIFSLCVFDRCCIRCHCEDGNDFIGITDYEVSLCFFVFII